MVPPIFVVIGGVTYEIVGVLCPLQTNLPRPTTSETAKNQVNIFLAIFGALAVQNLENKSELFRKFMKNSIMYIWPG